MSARIRVAKKRFKKYNPLFIGFVKQQLLPGKELFYISSSFDKIRCEIEDIINEYMKTLPIAFQITASPILLTKHPVRITDIEYPFSGTILFIDRAILRNLITRYKNLVAEMSIMSILFIVYIV